jgi:hypothetical protein
MSELSQFHQANGELTGTLVLLGDRCRNENKNLPLFKSLLITKLFPMKQFNTFGAEFDVKILK